MLSLHESRTLMTEFFRMLASIGIACGAVIAMPDAPAADEPPADSVSPRFQPGEISIGEPLQLPARPRMAAPADTPAFEAPRARPDATTQAPPAAGNGWIGLTVDDKVVTGRLVVVDVAAAGPADQVGIRLQDHLLAIDGVPLRSADQLAAALAAIAPGSTVKVAVGRGDQIDEIAIEAVARPAKPPAREWQKAEPGRPTVAREAPRPAVVTPTLSPPAVPQPVAAAAAKGRTALGVRTMPVDQSVAERFKLTQPSGALVIGVVHDLPASKAGVPPGSVIVALDNQPVRSPNELTQLVTHGPIGRPVTLQYILPGGEQRRAEVSLQSLEVPLERALVGEE
jgi:membrane-associated protease RseP (regulator of RpoE activity)